MTAVHLNSYDSFLTSLPFVFTQDVFLCHLINKGRIELPFPSVATWRSAGKLLIERIIFQKISNYHFCRPACNRKMFATNDTSQTCGFYHCISQQQNAKPTHNSTRRQFVLVLLLDHSSKPFTHSRQQSYPERQWPSTLEAPNKASSSCYCFPTLFTAAFHLTYQRLLSTQDVAKCWALYGGPQRTQTFLQVVSQNGVSRP